MGGSRRQRAKSEETFLESVKKLLAQLKEDVSNVKAVVEDLRIVQNEHRFREYGLPLWHESGKAEDDWASWLAMGFADMPKDIDISCDIENTQLRPDAPVFVTGQCPLLQVYNRQTLLNFRILHSDAVPPPELLHLNTAHLDQADEDPHGTSTETATERNHASVKGTPDLTGNTVACAKRGEAETQCICFDVYCISCLRTAEWCNCPVPKVRNRKCSTCDLEKDGADIFTKSLSQLNDFTNFVCVNCGGQSWTYSDLLSLGGAHPCEKCKRVDAQGTIVCCGGNCGECLFHTSCMNKVSAATFLCDECTATGVEFGVEISAEEEAASDESDIEVDASQQVRPTQDELWPDLSEDEQVRFKEWFDARKVKQAVILEKALNHILDEAEEAQAHGDAAGSRDKVNHARDLRKSVDNLGSMQHLRSEAWKFKEQHPSLNP